MGMYWLHIEFVGIAMCWLHIEFGVDWYVLAPYRVCGGWVCVGSI